MRAARIACTIGGIRIVPIERASLTSPLRISAPSSIRFCTISSMKNGLPSVLSIIIRLSATKSLPLPSNAESICSALSWPSGSSRNCV